MQISKFINFYKCSTEKKDKETEVYGQEVRSFERKLRKAYISGGVNQKLQVRERQTQ